MRRRIAPVCVVAALLAGTMAWAGHELPIYPSYYPHEIDITTVPPEQALALLEQSQIQAYIGTDPLQGAAPPDSVGDVTSLVSFLVVEINPHSPLVRNGQNECGVAAAVINGLAEHRG